MEPLVTIPLSQYKELEKKGVLYDELYAKYNDTCRHNFDLREKVKLLEKNPTYEQVITRYKYYLKWRLISHPTKLNLFYKEHKLKKNLSEEDVINGIVDFIQECPIPYNKWEC